MKSHDDYQIVILGAGFVGLTLCAALLKQGASVALIDHDVQTLESIANGAPKVYEPGLDAILGGGTDTGRLHLSSTLDQVRIDHRKRQVFVVCVGTPVSHGALMSGDLQRAVADLRPVVTDDCLVIIRSTVSPGSTMDIWRDFGRDGSSRPYVAMCPERSVEGDAVREVLELPQIIGGADVASSQMADEFFTSVGISTRLVSSATTAEFAKLMTNAFRDHVFAFSNEMARASEQLGVSIREAISAVNENYVRGGIPEPGPVGGPCLTKDPRILAASFSLDSPDDVPLILRARVANEKFLAHELERALREVHRLHPRLRGRLNVSLLGLAFKGKPATNDIRNSPSLDVARLIMDRYPKATVLGWDPVQDLELPPSAGVKMSSGLSHVLAEPHLVVVLTNSPVFRESYFVSRMNTLPTDCVVLDFWGVSGHLSGRVLTAGEPA